MPGVIVAGCDGLNALRWNATAYRDGYAGLLAGATTVVARDGVGVCCGGCDGDAARVCAGGPDIALRAGGGERGALAFKDAGVARDGYNRNWNDGQVQGVDLCAAVRVRMGILVGSALRVGGAVPGVLAALADSIGLVLWSVDGQVQGVHLCATVRVRMGVPVCSALGVGGAIPSVGFARVGSKCLMLWMEYCQVQGHDAVAAVGGTMGDGVSRRIGALRVGDTMPGVAVAGSGCLYTLCGNAVGHRDGDGGRLGAAAVRHSAYDSVCGCGGWTDRDRRGVLIVWIPMI